MCSSSACGKRNHRLMSSTTSSGKPSAVVFTDTNGNAALNSRIIRGTNGRNAAAPRFRKKITPLLSARRAPRRFGAEFEGSQTLRGQRRGSRDQHRSVQRPAIRRNNRTSSSRSSSRICRLSGCCMPSRSAARDVPFLSYGDCVRSHSDTRVPNFATAEADVQISIEAMVRAAQQTRKGPSA